MKDMYWAAMAEEVEQAFHLSQVGGLIPGSSWSHVKASLGKALNRNLPQHLKWHLHHHWCVLKFPMLINKGVKNTYGLLNFVLNLQ